MVVGTLSYLRNKHFFDLSFKNGHVVFLVVFFIDIAYNVHTDYLTFVAGYPPTEVDAAEQMLMRMPFCKIMHAYHEIGCGLRARALPTCK